MTRNIPILLLTLMLGWSYACAQDETTPGMLKVSELLYEPISGGAEYVELYNASPQELVCDSFCLIRWVGDSLGKRYPLPKGKSIPSHSYIVLTKDTDFVLSHYHVEHPQRLYQMSSMPTYPNDGGTVIVASVSGIIQERFDYDKSMHNPLLRETKGVALERISLDADANAPGNWSSASSLSGHGTPTSPNSQHVHQSVTSIALSSELFSPDGDGYQDEVQVEIETEEQGLSCNISIFEPQGRLVRHLLRNGLLGNEEHIGWDGKDDRMQACHQGSYIIIVELYNNKRHIETRKLAVSLIRR